MKRRKKIKPNAILCSDIHLRETQPDCRVDNFWETQWNKIEWLSKLQKKYNCLVLHAGDLFHHWKPSPQLISWALLKLPNMFSTVYGQHDLPQHNMELKYKSGIFTLEQAQKIAVLKEASWEQKPKEGSIFFPKNNRKILVWHKFNYQSKKPFPGATTQAAGLLRKYPQFDLILTGDNHQTFVEKYKGRLLVNPGSFTRQTSSQKDHTPCVFLYYAETNEIQKIEIPIKQDSVITPITTEKTKQREDRIQAFISSLGEDNVRSLSFEDSLKSFIENNNLKPKVKEIIYAIMGS